MFHSEFGIATKNEMAQTMFQTDFDDLDIDEQDLVIRELEEATREYREWVDERNSDYFNSIM